MSIYETIQQQAKTLGPWLRETRRARRGYFARCGGRVFRPLRLATRGSASGLRDFLKKIE